MAKMTAAEAAVYVLEKEGVTQLFGIPGAGINPVYAALKKHGTMKHILARHGEGIAHMAEGYTRAKQGNIGVGICTSGPAATDMITGLYSAIADSTPILAITGMDLLPSILTIGRFTEPEGISEQNALEFLFSGKCSAPLTEDGLQLVLESVYHPGETEAPPPQRVRRYRELWKHDIFRKTSS